MLAASPRTSPRDVGLSCNVSGLSAELLPTPPVPNQAQRVNLSAGHPNQVSAQRAQLEDKPESHTQIRGDKDEASEAALPGASLELLPVLALPWGRSRCPLLLGHTWQSTGLLQHPSHAREKLTHQCVLSNALM